MKPTDFAKFLTDFFNNYLLRQRNVSPNTIKSYRDTFRLLLVYLQDKEMKPEKVSMSTLTPELLQEFLDWLEVERKCSIATRNLRLNAIHSFFRYAQLDSPEALFNYQRIMAIPMKKKPSAMVPHLSPEGVRMLLEQPNRKTTNGRRDLALLSTMYDSGARVQEIIDLTARDFIPGSTPILVLTGKGSKARRVPLMENTAFLLNQYILENRLNAPNKMDCPLFTNHQHRKLSREGVAYILKKYAAQASRVSFLVPERMHCHMLRHSKAVHLLQAGVNLIYIRDFLGHCDIKTTEVYARADTETKRKVLENAYPELVDPNLPNWSDDTELMRWLSSL
jgi:site-specific recombinase XerD